MKAYDIFQNKVANMSRCLSKNKSDVNQYFYLELNNVGVKDQEDVKIKSIAPFFTKLYHFKNWQRTSRSLTDICDVSNN